MHSALMLTLTFNLHCQKIQIITKQCMNNFTYSLKPKICIIMLQVKTTYLQETLQSACIE